jgi:hypothetical protein
MNPTSLIQLPADVMHSLHGSMPQHYEATQGSPLERSLALAALLVAVCAGLVFGLAG